MKKMSIIAFAAMFSVASAGSAFAQAPAPASPSPTIPAKPTAAPAAPKTAAAPRMKAADKVALSKKCSADADAKGLKGKERKKFRNDCKRGKV